MTARGKAGARGAYRLPRASVRRRAPRWRMRRLTRRGLLRAASRYARVPGGVAARPSECDADEFRAGGTRHRASGDRHPRPSDAHSVGANHNLSFARRDGFRGDRIATCVAHVTASLRGRRRPACRARGRWPARRASSRPARRGAISVASSPAKPVDTRLVRPGLTPTTFAPRTAPAARRGLLQRRGRFLEGASSASRRRTRRDCVR